MIDFTINSFRRTWKDYPENLFRFSRDVLQEGMGDCHEAKVSAIAELFVRVFLSGNQLSEEAKIINDELPNGELEDFMSFFTGPHYSCESLEGNLWFRNCEFSRCCLASVRKRFNGLFRADGLIPVYCGNQAFIIPFHFDDTAPTFGVYDSRGSGNFNECYVVQEWSHCLKKLDIPSGIILHCAGTRGISLNDFTGNSLMLPVQMAWWRKQRQLPEYNIFRLFSTGAFDERLQLAPVDTKVKLKLLETTTRIMDYRFMYPESARDNVNNRNIRILPAGITREQLLRIVRQETERMARFDLEYALHRMDALSREVRLSNYKNWEALLQRLENAAVFDKDKKVNKSVEPEYYLVNIMLQSEAHRHAGHTVEASRLNALAMDYAKQHGNKFLSMLLKLRIERMVDFQDQEKFEDVLNEGELLRSELSIVNDNDLWMRFYGTMGQAYAYGALSIVPGCSPELALAHFNKAIDYAEELEELADIAHDKNYRYLFYALFAPGSAEEKDAYRQAENVCNALQKQDAREARKNLYHLKRYQGMAWYRQLLMQQNMELQPFSIDGVFRQLLRPSNNDSLDDIGADDWIRACVGKYLGALETANGNVESGIRFFSNAINAIGDEKHPGIKTLIRITVCAEAYRSLVGKDNSIANYYLDKARILIATLPKDASLCSLPLWKAYVEKPSTSFPGLSYWY